jgi:hypothetical protein
MWRSGSVSAEVSQFTVTQASVRNGHLELGIRKVDDPKDQDHFVMTLADHDHASLELDGWSLAPWRLVRVSDSAGVSVATSWPEPGPKVTSPEIAALQMKLRQMVAEDQAADAPTYSDFDKVC